MNPDKLSKALKAEVDCFLECTNAARLSRNLRFLLFGYLKRHQHDFPTFHKELLDDLEFLFFFLDKAIKEQRKRKRAKKATPVQPTTIERSSAQTS
jgi:hypothetical protein